MSTEVVPVLRAIPREEHRAARRHEGAVQGTRLVQATSHLSAVHIQGHTPSIVSGRHVCPCARLVATVANHSGGFPHAVGTKGEEEASIAPFRVLPRADPQGPALVTDSVGAVIKDTWERGRHRGEKCQIQRGTERGRRKAM